MFAPVIGAAYAVTTKREGHWSEQTKAQNTEKGMYVGLKQQRGHGERYVTPARAAAKETMLAAVSLRSSVVGHAMLSRHLILAGRGLTVFARTCPQIFAWVRGQPESRLSWRL